MRQNASPSRRFWVGASLGAMALVGALALLVRAPAPHPAQSQTGTGAGVGIAQLDGATSDALLREEALLRDPTPLFLPTAGLNVAQNVDPKQALREPGDTFRGYPEKLIFGLADVQFAFPPAVKTPGEKQPVDATSMTDWSMPLQGIGRSDTTIQALPARGAYIEVAATNGSGIGLSQALADAQPPNQQEWRPLEFLAAVEPGGLVGQPWLTVSSGVEKVDQYFLDYLVKQWWIGERLSRLKTGFYRIRLGP